MVIGIIGSGKQAIGIGRMLQSCGHTISFSDPHDSEAAKHAAEQTIENAAVDTAYNQAAVCEALVFAMDWSDVDTTLAAIGSYKDGLVIDATTPTGEVNGSGAEMLAKKLDNRHVVKAFVGSIEPGSTIRVASDDPEARMKVEEMISACGGKVEDAGPLNNATLLERDTAVI